MSSGNSVESATLAEVTRQCQALQQQLRDLQRVEAIGELTTGIAHDFNNLLTVILGTAELLLRSIEPTDARRQDVADIVAAATRAQGLTGQLLRMRRRRGATGAVDLNDVLEEMRDLLKRTLGEDIALTMDLAASVGRVDVDQSHLEQVVLNLVVNARDAMPNGGTLAISTRTETLTGVRRDHGRSAGPGRFSVIEVTDNGCGVDGESQPLLFNPLFTTKAHGTGVGLFTCDDIVTAAGGLITCTSAPGEGSVFTVFLPSLDRHPRFLPRPLPAATENTHGTEAVLLIEDDAETRGVIRRILEDRGYRVIEAPSGADALARAHSVGNIDLILCDVILPDHPGPEIARRVQQECSGAKTLFMSGHTTHALLRDGTLQAGTNFIQKPFGSRAFLKTVREVLNG